MKLFLSTLVLLSATAFADTPPARTINSQTFDHIGNGITSTLSGSNRGLDVNVINGSGSSTVNQGTPNAGGDNSWWVQGALGRTWTFSYTTDSTTSYQGGVWSTGRTWSLSSGSDSLTAYQGSGPWSENLTQLLGAAPSATNSLPARITNGTIFVDPTQIRSLSSASDSVTTVPSGTQTVVVSSGSITANQPTGTNLHTVVDSGSVTATISNPASNYALEAGGHLASIDTKLTSPIATNATLQAGSTVAVSSLPVNANSNLSSRQTVTVSESTLVAPANAVGVLFECESVNADNLRWGFSNSTGSILSSTLGVLCEPGRSVDYIPVGAGNYLHMIATAGGLDYMDVQWVLSQ